MTGLKRSLRRICQHQQMRHQTGFTLVELLIVIVVIGILATIIIISYSGIQMTARNTSRTHGAHDAYTTLLQYAVLNQAYPPVPPGPATVCIAGWDSTEHCNVGDDAVDRYAPFETAYRTVASAMPKYPAASADGRNGLVFILSSLYTIAGAPMPYVLSFFLEGNDQDCKMQGLVKGDGSGPYSFIPATKNSGTNGTITACTIQLPDPTAM